MYACSVYGGSAGCSVTKTSRTETAHSERNQTEVTRAPRDDKNDSTSPSSGTVTGLTLTKDDVSNAAESRTEDEDRIVTKTIEDKPVIAKHFLVKINILRMCTYSSGKRGYSSNVGKSADDN